MEEHVEVESGNKNRPALCAALEACKVLRLHPRADIPETNEMVVGIMALVAQSKRRMISERIKAALAASKARGVQLGNSTGIPRRATPEQQRRGLAPLRSRLQTSPSVCAPSSPTRAPVCRYRCQRTGATGIAIANRCVWTAGKVGYRCGASRGGFGRFWPST
jgi:hypothetical protein